MPGVLKAPRAESIRTHRVVRYLAYAIGEVLLIFIGITLAVAFSNMNEQRRTDDLERHILEAIVRNLEANVEQLDSNIDADEGSISALEPVLENLISENPWDDTLSASLDRSQRWSSPYFATSGYESLKQLGLHLVSDEPLRDELVDLFENTYATLLGDYDKAYWAFFEAVMQPVTNRALEQFDPEGPAPPGLRPVTNLDATGRTELLNMLREHQRRLNIGLVERDEAREDTSRTMESIERFLTGDE
jgi:hypothetical protein